MYTKMCDPTIAQSWIDQYVKTDVQLMKNTSMMYLFNANMGG